MALTDKKRRFVDAKAGGASNKEAAIAAGYAASSASAAGSRLAKDPQIIEALDKRSRVKASKGQPSPIDPPDSAIDDLPEDDQGGEILTNLPRTEDPLLWLLSLMNEPNAKVFDRRNAAQAALPYIHGKKADQGKKDQKAAAAKEAAKGKFGTSKPPLSVVGRT
ncbi:terminase small subunit [Pseudomonas tohonis]|uniref:terminase small subunit n=1 Tax=Pseudomonas tohonis TaxID=2725477 RepID=UPI001F4615A2|nr:terminase small subunit [Pseudomonas tohonis]